MKTYGCYIDNYGGAIKNRANSDWALTITVPDETDSIEGKPNTGIFLTVPDTDIENPYMEKVQTTLLGNASVNDALILGKKALDNHKELKKALRTDWETVRKEKDLPLMNPLMSFNYLKDICFTPIYGVVNIFVSRENLSFIQDTPTFFGDVKDNCYKIVLLYARSLDDKYGILGSVFEYEAGARNVSGTRIVSLEKEYVTFGQALIDILKLLQEDSSEIDRIIDVWNKEVVPGKIEVKGKPKLKVVK